jgi:hypothetical protein
MTWTFNMRLVLEAAARRLCAFSLLEWPLTVESSLLTLRRPLYSAPHNAELFPDGRPV